MELIKNQSTIPAPYMSYSLNRSYYPKNNLFTYLNGLFGRQQAEETFIKYLIGTGKVLKGAALLWSCLSQEDIRYCKLLLINPHTGKLTGKGEVINRYNKDLKTYKPEIATGFCAFPCGNLLDSYTEALNLQPILYGSHLLAENKDSSVCVVENELCAILCSVFYPSHIWLAIGNADLYDPEIYSILNKRNVFIFPSYGLKNGKPKQVYLEQTIKELQGRINGKIMVTDFVEKAYTLAKQNRNNQTLADLILKGNMTVIASMRRIGLNINPSYFRKYQSIN